METMSKAKGKPLQSHIKSSISFFPLFANRSFGRWFRKYGEQLDQSVCEGHRAQWWALKLDFQACLALPSPAHKDKAGAKRRPASRSGSGWNFWKRISVSDSDGTERWSLAREGRRESAKTCNMCTPESAAWTAVGSVQRNTCSHLITLTLWQPASPHEKSTSCQSASENDPRGQRNILSSRNTTSTTTTTTNNNNHWALLSIKPCNWNGSNHSFFTQRTHLGSTVAARQEPHFYFPLALYN